jgi:putative transposase
MPGFDYSHPGIYFVTVCLEAPYQILFGAVENGEIWLNEYGIIVRNEWTKTENIRSNVMLDEFVIMPNHVHGIIRLVEITVEGTARRAPTIKTTEFQSEKFSNPTVGTIPTIVRSFKSAVTKQINTIRNANRLPLWQRNYFERVLRDEESVARVQRYIRENPLQWTSDNENIHLKTLFR